jgi:DNA-binding NtrC family response regulator
MALKQILIVDDKPVLATGLAEVLKQSNQQYQVSVVHSGEEALERLHRSPQDLLITDLCMSGINGMELIRRVRDFYPHMPTILTTARGDDAVERKARSAGAWGFIAKPFDLQLLVETVDDVLHSPRAERISVEQR